MISMKKTFLSLTSAVLFSVSMLSTSAQAALPVGAQAPDFQLQGALAGKPLTFSLKQELQKGPVVLYFFPAADRKSVV